MADNAIDFEEYLKAREASVAKEQQEENNRRIYRRGYKKGLNRGFTEGIKRGFIAGAIAAVLVSGTLVLGYNGIKDSVTTALATNVSVDYGEDAVSVGTHPASDPGKYWYDYREIALEYDAKSMDFDSFVYGAFRRIGWNESSALECMDHLFSQLHSCGYTDYSSFASYCASKGACREVDGRLVVDTDKYRDLVREYIQSLNSVEKQQEDVNGFRQGK